jgi:tetratricopeptide (TPR) repeat protein
VPKSPDTTGTSHSGERSRAPAGRGRRPGVRPAGTGLVLVLMAVLALTAWQAARSDALVQAHAAYDGLEPPLHFHTLWETARRAWMGTPGGPKRARGQPDFRLALQHALDQLDRRPSDPTAGRLAALCLSQLDYADRAEPYYRIAREGRALSDDDLRVRALGLARGNLREEAIGAFQEILSHRPDDAFSLQRLAAIYYSQTRLRDALATAQRLAEAPGGAVAGHALIGIVYHDDHRFDQAIAAYEKVLALDPDLSGLSLPSTLFHTDLAQDLLAAGRPADARRHLERALVKSEDPVLLDLLGLAFRDEGEVAKAEDCWKRAAELDPKMSRPWLNLGISALASGRIDEAVALLEKARALDPESLEPAYQLGLAYRRAGRTADAERFRKRAEEIRRRAAPGPRAEAAPGGPP